MLKQLLSALTKIYFFLALLIGCAPSGGSDSSKTSDPKTTGKSIVFDYNRHESLPSEWNKEFDNIMNELNQIIPTPQVSWFPTLLDVYAWKDNVYRPFGDQYSGQCICGNGEKFWMSLEMSSREFTYDHMHRYSVIVHEYYHV
jgi:hypothetical protein